MAEMGVFIGWGPPVGGREKKGLEIFNEASEAWAGFEKDGRIESFEVVILYPHGGDLTGFALLRGSAEQCDALRASEDFQRLISRANLIAQGLGVVSCALGGSLPAQVALYEQAVGELD
jgi:hypothetical protein